jgi:hypothetical protein
MRSYLRSIGVRVPITGVVSNDIIPDVASAGLELDFTSENYYGDHPAFSGPEWQGKYFHNNSNPLRSSSTYQFAPWLAALRWENKPVVVREYATVWPNRYRAVGIPEAAAYSALQDFDAVLLFGYKLAPDPELIGDFDHQADPPVWGLFALGAQSFLRGDIAPSPQTITIEYSADSLFRWPNRIGDLHRLAWVSRLNSRLASPAGTNAGGRAHRTAASTRGRGIFLPRSAPLTKALDNVVGGSLKGNVLRSGTGQIERRTGEGLLKVITPRTIMLAGELPMNRPIVLGPITVITPTPIGGVMAVSMDGAPLGRAKRYLIKMVSEARNTGQDLVPAAPGSPARYYVNTQGRTPILTGGKPSARPTILSMSGRRILSLGLESGVWELLVDGQRATLVCDTAGIRGTLFDRPLRTDGIRPSSVSDR